MRLLFIGLLIGLVLGASGMAVAQWSSHENRMPGSLTPQEQQALFNLQQQLNTLPRSPNAPQMIVPVVPPC